MLLSQTNVDFSLSLMHVNDTHANTDKAPKLVTAIKEVRAKNPSALLMMQGMYSLVLYISMNSKDKQI